MSTVLSDGIKSFYSRPFYYELARLRQGIGMGLIGLLTLGSFLIIMTMFFAPYGEIQRALRQLPATADTIPAVTVVNGKISIDKPSPYFVHLGEGSQAMAIVIDTNYKITDVDALFAYMERNKLMALVTADKIVMLKDKKGQLDIQDVTKNAEPINITHEDWRRGADFIMRWGMTFVVGFFILLFTPMLFVAYLFATFITAIVTALLGWILRADIDFSASMRISAAARIPVAVISFAPTLFHRPMIQGGLWLVLVAVYILFGVWSARPQNAASA